MTRPGALAAALLATSIAWALAAAAAAPLVADVRTRSGRLEVSVDLGAAFPADLERRLGNGLTNVVTVHLSLLPAARGGQPAAIHAREIQVLYDVWDETWGVLVRDEAAPQGRRLTFAKWPELRRFLVEARAVALGPVGALEDGAWVVQARVELNPISKELLERTRELIANPAAARGGPSRSVLGAMASYLLREPPAGTEARILRSRPFTASDVKVAR